MSDSYHVVCPSCQGVNRLPGQADAAVAKCGKCGSPLFRGEPAALSETSFQRFVERTDIPVVVDFWAQWCGPCRMMAPVFSEAARLMEPRVRFAKVDTESAQGIATRYEIRSIPTIVLFRKGREIARQAGAMDLGNLRRWIEGTVRQAA